MKAILLVTGSRAYPGPIDAIALAIGELARRGIQPVAIRRALAINLVNVCRASGAGDVASIGDVRNAISFWRVLKQETGQDDV